MAEDTPSHKKIHLVMNDGPIIGCTEESDVGKLKCFYGIPYAKPPIGQLRFLPPVPVQPWENEIDCTKNRVIIDHDTWSVIEDCLYINVKSKNMNHSKPLPVMFWIGGHKYVYSFDSMLDPSLLIQEDVIFVNCGYRQGPFGFLSINEPVAPGNSGLKDIALALKWVQRNIAAFGGDPNNVTLFGSDSGAPIVHLMILSLMTTGLFHKAIIQSASALNSWAVMKNPSLPVMDLAKQLGMETTCKTEIVERLKTVLEKDIIAAYKRMIDSVMQEHCMDPFNLLFKPCIEEEFEGQATFISKSPALILKSGKFNRVPIIIGCNNIEASVLQFIDDDIYRSYQILNKNNELITPKELNGDIVQIAKKVGKQILDFYVGEVDESNSPQENTRMQYMQMIGDYYFNYFVNKSVRLHSQYASQSCPVYYYILNNISDWRVSKDCTFVNFIAKCGDLPYMFGIKPPGAAGCAGAGRQTLKVRRQIVKMWTNFAKYGDPTPSSPADDSLLQVRWEPVQQPDRLDYLQIGSELTKGRNPFYERMMFWDKLQSEHIFHVSILLFNEMGVKW